jgi:hypothetical protein
MFPLFDVSEFIQLTDNSIIFLNSEFLTRTWNNGILE